MTALGYLLPIALLAGLAGLAAFFWTLRSGQYDDLDGAAARILIDEEEDSFDDDQGEAPSREA
ncbi:cbb3-type cytochrome oxidase assembly protein CcoS [Sphingomicrobium arenosum]|uniref:cbb3-type cytochrome oxidase assembly protein CcoS n=1 Tax=Sphingomicrobium arenosum TaxID=2233861 RepID=UPI002240F334|nr:cbb3-type cytochrome oxidase assembly protein CcoS [Sphingomicrobium arenosum]